MDTCPSGIHDHGRLRSPDLRVFKVQNVIQMKRTLFPHHSPPFICLPYFLKGQKNADGNGNLRRERGCEDHHDILFPICSRSPFLL